MIYLDVPLCPIFYFGNNPSHQHILFNSTAHPLNRRDKAEATTPVQYERIPPPEKRVLANRHEA